VRIFCAARLGSPHTYELIENVTNTHTSERERGGRERETQRERDREIERERKRERESLREREECTREKEECERARETKKDKMTGRGRCSSWNFVPQRRPRFCPPVTMRK
jgi:hypothetical protein